MVGQVVGHYHIGTKIGEGQFSIVYRGRDIRLGRMVAVKVLKENHPEDSSIWGRLLREARIVSTLNHPNICALYDIGEEQGINYFIFELVEGKMLRAVLDSGPLPTGMVFQYAIQIAEAIAHTHAAGILHRDFKSSNIMVTPAGQIKVIDFGLAKVLEEGKAKQEENSHSSAQEIGWLIGTLPYMAPEILHGEAPTTQAGVWSLGVVLFEMLTGELPFTGKSPFELGMDIMIGKRKPLPMDIPAGLRAIIQRCLMHDRKYRYRSAADVLTHLQSEFVEYQIKAALARRPFSQSKWYDAHAGWLVAALTWMGFLSK
jgi:eukaryotic-like serine/threonine-protein kinase